jgi:ribonuclease HI
MPREDAPDLFAPARDLAGAPEVELFADGACSGNPGPGGWGFLLRMGAHEREGSGGEKPSTNNRMEILAVIRGLEALTRPCRVKVVSDSRYVVQAIEDGWIAGWKKRGWKRKGGELLNTDLWKRLDELLAIHDVHAEWVEGHAGHVENERVDKLAQAAARAQKG